MKISSLIMASRPKTLLISLSPIMLAFSYVAQLTKNVNWVFVILTAICAILLQMASNLVNDYYDHIDGIDDQKERLGPRRAVDANLLSLQEIKRSFVILFAFALFIGCYLSYQTGFELFILGIVSIAIAYMYTGGPIPLSRIALGEVLAFVFFGIVPFIGISYIENIDIHLSYIILSLVPSSFAAMIMLINNIRDIQGDKKSGKMTLATFLGFKRAKYLFFILTIMALSPLFILTIINADPFYLLACIPSLKSLSVWIDWPKPSKESALIYNDKLATSAKILFLTSLILIIILIYQ